MYFNDKVTKIKGIGEKKASDLAKLGIFTAGDLLMHFPRRYESYGEIVPAEFLKDKDTSVIECKVQKLPSVFTRNGVKITRCTVKDSTGSVEVFWFNMPFIGKSLRPGTGYLLRGKVSIKNGRKMMIQPKLLTREEYYNNKNKYMPLYHLTEGITDNALRKYVAAALEDVEIQTADMHILPPGIQKKYGLMRLDSAFRKIHFPESPEEYMDARKRLVFDEFYEFFLKIEHNRAEKKKKKNDFKFSSFEIPERIAEKLPYKLTEGQLSAWNDIKSDLCSSGVMTRLIQGDVGCGKTAVSMLAAAAAVENGYQAAVMAPTQVLARQHYENFKDTFKGVTIRGKDVDIELLDSSVSRKEKDAVRKKIKSGEAGIVIGTHALLSDNVQFEDLALAVTDEQHRFGIMQKKNLSMKGNDPHVLVMSATPIPRSLAAVIFGDLDISTIMTMPENRKPVKNCAVDISYRKAAYDLIEKEVRAGHQAYVICPMVEESEDVEAENCVDYTAKLKKIFSPDIKVDFIHGRMKAAEKDEKLISFASNRINVLVSTTVIEVGIDVPNATVMLIENADRFGLAALHQLRGRIGRGSAQSYCIFMTDKKLSESNDRNDIMKAKRLDIISHSNDGFEIANEDLKNRGPGDINGGIRQSGEIGFRIADICADADIMREAWETVRPVV